MEYVNLTDEVRMPVVGFGTSFDGVANPEPYIRDAIDVGYRLIDSAQLYGTEAAIGRAIAESGVPREEFFLITKVWFSHEGSLAQAKASIDASLGRLKTDYVDLLMVHQPFGDYYTGWRACEAALASGKARAIGVSNFYADRIADLCQFAEVKPVVDQVETHVFYMREALRRELDADGVLQMAWAPLARGGFNIFKNPILALVAEKHGKSVGQVALKYLLAHGIPVIPKSAHKERMVENLDLFDFELDDDDKAAIAGLNEEKTAFFDHYDPALVKEMATWTAD